MRRLCSAAVIAFCAGMLLGCEGESQPNASATNAEAASPEFAAKSAADMQKANVGLDQGNVKPGAPAAPKK